MTIVGWIILGVIAGVLATWLFPGRFPGRKESGAMCSGAP